MAKDVKNTNKKNFKEWLEFLQQESWQLELIISSILLLILGSSDNFFAALANNYGSSSLGLFIGLLIPIIFFLKTNLVIHIFFRGLWIGCIGLRYVSEDIDFDMLSYAERFNRFLRKKVKSFDNYIEKLERISSIIFSYSFLMVFHFVSFCLFILFIFLIIYIDSEFLDIPKFISIVIVLVFVLAGILNFIDFLTLGLLKRYKRTSLVFYPFYKIYNLVSFSFLYRPLHYNFIDNPLGRRYMFFMIPYILILIVFMEGISIGSYNYIPLKSQNSNWTLERYYDDLRKNERINMASIDRFIYNDEPLQLFIRYNDKPETEKCLKHICPDFEPYNRNEYELNVIKGIKEGFNIRKRNKEVRDLMKSKAKTQADNSIDCISHLYSIKIDSMSFTNKEFIFYEHANQGEVGLLTVIDISILPKGKHTLILETKTDFQDNEFITETIEIPFFKRGVALNLNIK